MPKAVKPTSWEDIPGGLLIANEVGADADKVCEAILGIANRDGEWQKDGILAFSLDVISEYARDLRLMQYWGPVYTFVTGCLVGSYGRERMPKSYNFNEAVCAINDCVAAIQSTKGVHCYAGLAGTVNASMQLIEELGYADRTEENTCLDELYATFFGLAIMDRLKGGLTDGNYKQVPAK